MALQDVCGFQDIPMLHRWNIPALLSRPVGDTTHLLDNFGWGKPNSSERDGGVPLHFFIPSPQSSVHSHYNGKRSSSFSPSTSVRRPFPLSHGTTTLAFVFQGGVIAAADTRASCAGLVACPFVQKITPIHSHLVATSSGSGADCQLWERILTREIRLYQLRHRRRLSISGTAKLLSHMLHPFKGTDVCVAATLCGWDEEEARVEKCVGQKVDEVRSEGSGDRFAAKMLPTETGKPASDVCTQDVLTDGVTDKTRDAVIDKGLTRSPVKGHGGPKLIYVCSDGARLQGQLFSVGSGSPYAYGILDGGLQWALSEEEAMLLAREAVFRATHRDAYSGNNVDVFHITAKGWCCREREDLKEEYHRERERVMKRVQKRIEETERAEDKTFE